MPSISYPSPARRSSHAMHASATSSIVSRRCASGFARNPLCPQPLERLPLRGELDTLEDADPVDEDREWPLRGDTRVELSQRPCGGVPRVRSGLLPGGELRLVEAYEALDREVDLPSHLDPGRRRIAEHPERDRLDGAQVGGHVLPALAVPARRSPDERAALVDQRHGRAVDLRLEDVGDGLVGAEALADVVRPLLERLARRDLLERAHGRQVRNLREPGCRRGTDPLRRRVRTDELGMLLLERLELVEERVVRRVVDLWVVEDVVAVVVAPDQPAELRGALGRRGGRPRGQRAAPRACARRRRAPRRGDARPGGSLPTRRRRRRRPPLCRADVEGRIADVDRFVRRAAESLDREQNGLGIGLVPTRVLESDDDVESCRKRRKAVECEPDGPVALRGHDAQLPPLRLQPRKEGEQLVEGLERLVQTVVVLLVRLEQLVDVIRVDGGHLGDDALAADRHLQLGRRDLAAEDGADRVLHRREDDRPRVDQRAVEVEEDDAEAHAAIVAAVSSPPSRGTGRAQAPSDRPLRADGRRGAARCEPARPAPTPASCRRASAPCDEGSRSRLIVKSRRASFDVPTGGEHVPHEDVVPRLGRCEGAEVVLADEQLRGGAQSGGVDRTSPLEGPASVQRRSPARVHAVPVRAGSRREAGMEPVRRLLDCRHGDVLRQRRGERFGRVFERRSALHVDARNLPRRMHAGVRAARDRKVVPAREDRVESVSYDPLYRAETRLPRPAAKPRPVVLQRQLQTHGRSLRVESPAVGRRWCRRRCR